MIKNSVPNVKKERTGWRDKALAVLHNKYRLPYMQGDNFLGIEYNHYNPIAVINYGFQDTIDTNTTEWYIFCDELADKKFPVFSVQYFYNEAEMRITSFKINPENTIAEKFMYDHNISYSDISEKEFVLFLFKLRGDVKQNVIDDVIHTILTKKLCVNVNWFKEITPSSIISSRHRDYSWDNPVVDIDFAQVFGKRVLIEYKESGSNFDVEKELNSANISVLNSFALMLGVSFYCVNYNLSEGVFKVTKINTTNKTIDKTKTFTTQEYFSWINGEHMLDKIHNENNFKKER